MKRYFKRQWEELRGDEYDFWGTATYYFETDSEGWPLRQIQVYENGNRLKYSANKTMDEYGGLGDQKLELETFNEFEITIEQFEKEWGIAKMNPAHQEIIDLISNYLANNHSLRFGQALFNLGVNEFADKNSPENKDYGLRDIYNDADREIQDRIKVQLERFEKY